MEDFEELRHLGRGAFGEVLLMRQTSTGLLCAVKKLGKTALPAGEEAEHLAEVKVLQTLEHPCILRYYGSIQLDESLSLVMEFADSGDLQQLLKKQMDSEKLFEVAALFAIFSQLVVAMAHVHARRVLHRDLKPSNVMLTSSGLLKLGDFGVAKVMAGTTVVDNMTCVVSPTYMAPEIVAGEAYGAPCDVWSLGVMLYELASFKRPFEGRSLGELIMRISSGKFESVGAHLADKPGGHVLEDAVAPVLAKMLVVDPKGRGRISEVVRAPSVQTFVASLKTSAVIVASIIQELEDPQKSKGIDVNTAAVDELIAELSAKSPKRAEAAENLPKGVGQVRGSLAAKVDKQVVEDDSLALSLTSSDLGTAVLAAKHHGQNSSGEVSFNLTATDALQVSKKVPVPVLNEDTHEAVKAVSQKFGQRSGGLGVSHDNHALRDVLGDALELGGTSRTEQGTAKSDALARSSSNTSTQMRSQAGGLPMQGTRDLAEAVLRDAMGPEVSARSGPLQSTSGTVVAEGEAGSVHFEHVTPGWKVKSSRTTPSGRHSDSSSSSPPASREQRRLPIVTREQAGHAEVAKRDGRAPSLRAAGAVLGSQPLRAPSTVAPGDASAKRRPSHGGSSRGSQGDNDRSVTWPQMPPIEVLVPQPRESRARLRSTTPPAGRPTTPDSARKARVDKDQKKELQRNGAMTIPFHDGPKSSAPQPPKAFLDRMEKHKELQEKKAERIKDMQTKTAPAAPERREIAKAGRGLMQDNRSRTHSGAR